MSVKNEAQTQEEVKKEEKEKKPRKPKGPKLVYEEGMTLTKKDKLRIGQDFIEAYFENNSVPVKQWNEWMKKVEAIYADPTKRETKKFSEVREEFCSRFLPDLAKHEEEKLSFIDRMKRVRK